MGDNLDSAVNSLGEQTKKLEIASFYTHGDFDKAKDMVSGSYKDMYVLRIRFSSSSMYGASILFFNVPYLVMHDSFCVVSQHFDVAEIKTNVDWKNFEKELQSISTGGNNDQVLGSHLREMLISGFTMQTTGELKKLIENNDAIAVNHLFQKVIQDKTGYQKVQVSVDYDQISSLDMELFSVTSKKINPNELARKKEEEEKKKLAESAPRADSDDPLAGKEIKLVLRGSLILSPIKGKEISTLAEGDRIKISLIDKNPKAIDVARAFNAYDKEEGRIRPIAGRVISIKYTPKSGYKIFAVVAKGIYVQIEEEEENIKVAMDGVVMSDIQEKQKDLISFSIPVMVGLVILLSILIGVIVIFIK